MFALELVYPNPAIRERQHLACAVKRRRFPVGESPTRQMLQPEATGAGMEVTKCLKRASSEGWLDQQGTDLPGQQSEAP